MPRYVIKTSLTRDQLRDRLAELPQILSGKAPDRYGIARGFMLRLAVAFFSKIKQAFIVKSRGGVDACGIKWPPLSKKYLAYQRGPKSTRWAGKHAPGGKDGFMSAAQLKSWRQTYGVLLGRFAATMPLDQAKGKAAAIAWILAKRAGVKTKLEVFGSRDHEILRDRGLLFNSLSPGIGASAGADFTYTPPVDQIVDAAPGRLLAGTNVEYAKYHQGDDTKPGRRRFFPRADEIPNDWQQDFDEQAAGGLHAAILLLSKGA